MSKELIDVIVLLGITTLVITAALWFVTEDVDDE